MQEKRSTWLLGRSLNILTVRRRRKYPSSSHGGSRPRASQTRMFWSLILTLSAAIPSILLQPSTAQADGTAPHPLFASDIQVLEVSGNMPQGSYVVLQYRPLDEWPVL